MMLGVAYSLDGQHTLAIPAFREALGLKPDNSHIWYLLGEAYAREGDRQRVREVYQHLKTLDEFLADQFLRKFILP